MCVSVCVCMCRLKMCIINCLSQSLLHLLLFLLETRSLPLELTNWAGQAVLKARASPIFTSPWRVSLLKQSTTLSLLDGCWASKLTHPVLAHQELYHVRRPKANTLILSWPFPDFMESKPVSEVCLLPIPTSQLSTIAKPGKSRPTQLCHLESMVPSKQS